MQFFKIKHNVLYFINGTYREILGNVGEFFFGFLGNPEGTNFS